MARQRTIVGIGEAVLCDYPDHVEAGGLAISIASAAQRLGHRGVPISRLGQDQDADEIISQLRDRNISVDHLQSDPDLPTGHLTVRTIAGKHKRTLSPRAAFDALQWDFDLVDVAQTADGVVFGALAQREGLSQSIIKRFLAECGNAVRMCDLMNRADSLDRLLARSNLEYAEGVVADVNALKMLAPGWDGRQTRDAAVEIMRSSELAFVITIEPGECSQTMTAHAAASSTPANRPFPAAQHDMAMVAFLHGVLNGWDMPRCVELACAAAEYASKHKDQALPRELL